MVCILLEPFPRKVPMAYGCVGVVTRPQLYMVSLRPSHVSALLIRVPQVSPWMEKGNLLTYVKNTPEADKNYLVGWVAGHIR